MKFKIVLLTLFFIITTSFAAIHETEHITHQDADVCLICTIADTFQSSDPVASDFDVNFVCCKKITYQNFHFKTNILIFQSPARAPPSFA